MPRFHFNVYDGTSLPDPAGTELAQRDEARIEAIRVGGEVLKDTVERLLEALPPGQLAGTAECLRLRGHLETDGARTAALDYLRRLPDDDGG